MANYLPFNSINADRAVKAEDWAWYFSTFIGNGVFPKPTNGLQVLADEGMNITIKTGFGFINGYAFRNPSDYSMEVAMADGTFGRIDRVVLRWNLTDREIVLAILQGSTSASPTAPELTRNGSVYELALADISVTAGLTTITQSHITDRRTNTDLCGIVEGTVSQIDWSALTAQLDAFMAEYSERIVTFEEGFESNANDWFADEQDVFKDWVATLHDILDTETAGHLQNEIENLQSSKQDNLTAGPNISIDNGVISAFGPFSFNIEEYEGETGHLVMYYTEGYDPDQWSLNSEGHLIMTMTTA